MSFLPLEQIYARCTEVGDCLEWGGSIRKGKNLPVYGKDQTSVRRMVVEQSRGGPIPTALHPVPKCRNPRCVRDEHLVLNTKVQILSTTRKAGKLQVASAAKLAVRRARPDVKLSMDAARDIRRSVLPSRTLAEQYGVTMAMVTRIRRNEAWRESVQGASVFSL